MHNRRLWKKSKTAKFLLFLVEEKKKENTARQKNSQQLHEGVTRKDKKDKLGLGCTRQSRTV